MLVRSPPQVQRSVAPNWANPIGQLTRVTLPDTSWVGYDYDDTHRLVAVYDHRGNRIAEQTKDPAGALKRQLECSIDPLGCTQHTTEEGQRTT